MIRNVLLLAALNLLMTGCATSPARFETSDAPPVEPEDVRPPSGYQAPIHSPAASTHRLQQTTDRFLLALQNRASDQLEAILSPDATVREQGSGSGNSALPSLLDLTNSWSDLSSAPAGTTALSPAPFGPAKIIEIQTLGSEAWATIEVAGPPKVEGLWKIRLGDGREMPQVEEVIVPKFH